MATVKDDIKELKNTNKWIIGLVLTVIGLVIAAIGLIGTVFTRIFNLLPNT